MIVDPSIERAEPGSGNARDSRHADPILHAEANAALERWLQDHPEIEGELKETVRAHIHFQELEARTREAERALQTAEQRYAVLQTRHDVAGHRIFGCTIGLALVAALVVLDAVPPDNTQPGLRHTASGAGGPAASPVSLRIPPPGTALAASAAGCRLRHAEGPPIAVAGLDVHPGPGAYYVGFRGRQVCSDCAAVRRSQYSLSSVSSVAGSSSALASRMPAAASWLSIGSCVALMAYTSCR